MNNISVNYISLHAKKLDNTIEYFTITNNDGEWDSFINQYFILHELMSRLKLVEPVMKKDNFEHYVVYKKPFISIDFINNNGIESIKLSIIFNKDNMKILNNVATITLSDDEDDYDISLREFIESCIKYKNYNIDSFISIEELKDNKMQFTAIISE